MNDLISRQAAIDAMEQAKEQYFDRRVIIGKMQDIVNNLPSAQPEIVMCKDCKKYIDYRCRDEHANLSDWRHEDDYCSYAERREVNK